MQSNIGVLGYMMKPRDSAVKAKRFEVAEKARKIASLEGTIRDFEMMAADLARQIANEEDRTGDQGPGPLRLLDLRQGRAQRRANLLTSVADLKDKLALAKSDHADAALALKRLEPAAEERDRWQSKGVSRIVASG